MTSDDGVNLISLYSGAREIIDRTSRSVSQRELARSGDVIGLLSKRRNSYFLNIARAVFILIRIIIIRRRVVCQFRPKFSVLFSSRVLIFFLRFIRFRFFESIYSAFECNLVSHSPSERVSEGFVKRVDYSNFTIQMFAGSQVYSNKLVL